MRKTVMLLAAVAALLVLVAGTALARQNIVAHTVGGWQFSTIVNLNC